MKHQLLAELEQMMSEAALPLSGAEPVMVRHVEWLLRTNERLNLTAINAAEDALLLHVVDSLEALPEVLAAPAGRMVDVGTGGGFPGLPLGLAGDRETVLMDSVAKKVRAIQEFLDQEGLSQFSIAPVRAEDYSVEHPASAAVVICRAVAPLGSLLELAAPILQSGGHFIALKAPLSEQEFGKACDVAEIVGLELTSRRFLSLPRAGGDREVLSFRSARASSVRLPRRVGLAQKRPLGR